MIKKLQEINANRGKKSTNRKIHVKYLQELYKLTVERNFGVGILAKILSSIISALFELNTKICEAMDFNLWTKLVFLRIFINIFRTLETISGLFDLLAENPNVHISILTHEDDENLIVKTKFLKKLINF